MARPVIPTVIVAAIALAAATAGGGAGDEARQSLPRGTIAFTSDRAGLDDIYLMSGRGTNQRRLTPKAALHADDDPEWSPAGDRVVFERQLAGFDRDESDRYALHVINADGTGLQRLVGTEGGDYLGNPVWSPDGLTIAYDTFSSPAQGSRGEWQSMWLM